MALHIHTVSKKLTLHDSKTTGGFMPIRHKIQCNNFSVPYLVDKTLLDNAERCSSAPSLSEQMQLLYDLSEAGISNFILGGDTDKTIVWEQCRVDMQQGQLPDNAELTYKVALNRWEATYNHFAKAKYDKQWIAETIFTFTMDSYDNENRKFINAITAFKRLGAKKFKVSIDNIFINGVTSTRYLKICQQISVAESYGVKFIRINDTLGWLQPAETLTLCSALVRHYPRIIFSLNTYNDRGLALRNIMMSLQSGFQMLEGSLVRDSNTSRSNTTEKVLNMCIENNIKVGKRSIDRRLLSHIILPNSSDNRPELQKAVSLNNGAYSNTMNSIPRRNVVLH